MEFTKIISSPVFAASAPDIGLEAQSASPVKIVVTTPSASWDITLSPVSDADGKNLLNIRLRDILSAVASAPAPSETEPNSAIPLLMVNLSASNTEGEQASMDIPVAFGTLNGKDPKDFTGQWLTSREQICLTYSWARERLSLIFGPQLLRWSGSVSLTVNCRAYYASGKARNFQLVSAGSSDAVYYSVDCSYSAISALDDSGEQLVAWDLSYTLSGINADGESDSVDSFPQRFILANQDGHIREYIFANCFGMEDRVFGEGVARREVSGSSSTFVNGGKTLEVSNDAEIVYEAFSGQLADRRAVFHWYDFLSSSSRLIFSAADGSMTHIVVEGHDSETDDFSVGGVSFSYRLSEKNGVYPDGLCGTIGDYDPNQQCGALWVGDDPQAVTPAEEDLFFLKHRLSEFQTLTVSDALLLLVQSPATDAWGSVSLGSIKSWIKKFLDGESREIRLNSLADYETADGKVIDPAKLQNGSIPVWDAAAGAYHPVPASELGDYGINPKLYPLVFQKGKDVVLTYAPNVGKAVLDISDFASAETLSTHISDKDIHVTAEQKSAWDLVASLFGVNEEGNIYIKDDRGLISYSFVSVHGSDPEAGSSSAFDSDVMWTLLGADTAEKINISHLPSIPATMVSGLGSATAGKVAHSLTVKNDGGSATAQDKIFDGGAAVTVTIPTSLPASDVPSWAKSATKPSYTWSEIDKKPSTLSGFGITDGVNDAEASGNLTGSVSGHKLKIGVADGYTIPSVEKIALWDKICALFDIDDNGDVRVTGGRGLSSDSFISVHGSDPEAGQGGIGGLDIDAMWEALAESGTQKINASHIPLLQQLSGTLTNAQLANSSLSVAGVSVALGGAVSTEQIAGALGLGSNAYTSTAYLPLAGGTMTGEILMTNSKAFVARMATDTSNYRTALGWRSVASGALIAQIGYWNTDYSITLNPCSDEVSEVWVDEVGKYNFVVGKNRLTYNTYPLLYTGNYSTYLDTRYLLKSSYTAADILAKLKTVDGSGSGLDADLLDGYHATSLSRLLSYINSGNKAAAGWYRVFTASSGRTNALGVNIMLHLARSFNYEDNEAYTFCISVAFNNKVNITQVSGHANVRLITKIRVVSVNSGALYVDFYLSRSTNGNTYYITGSGPGTFQEATAVSTPGGNVTEFETVNGCKSSGGFIGALSGNASSATKLAAARLLWGRSFDGSGDIRGNIIVGDAIIHGSVTSNNTRFISSDNASNIYFSVGGLVDLVAEPSCLRRGASNTSETLGTSTYRWANVYAVNGDCSGNLTVSGWINGGLNISIFGSNSDNSDTTRFLTYGHNVEFGGPGYAHVNYYLRPRYGASGETRACLFIQNASAAASPVFSTTHAFYNNGNAYHYGNLGLGTAAPQAKLDVNGNIKAVGITMNGQLLNSNGNITCGDFRVNFGQVELYGSTPFIDFHYGSSTADYTSRLIEGVSGQLTITGNLQIGGSYSTASGYRFSVNGTSNFTNLVRAVAGVQIGSTSDIGWYLNSGRIVAGQSVARGVNVGSLLVSGAWADYTKVPTNGIYSKGDIYSMGAISCRGADSQAADASSGIDSNALWNVLGAAGTEKINASHLPDSSKTLTCSTAAGTAAKVVTCTGFQLTTGAAVTVRFTSGNSAASPTLNVNGTGAKGIRVYRGTSLVTPFANWNANVTVELTYNGTYWVITGNPVVYSLNAASASDSGGTYYRTARIFADGWKEYAFVTNASGNDRTLTMPYAFSSVNSMGVVVTLFGTAPGAGNVKSKSTSSVTVDFSTSTASTSKRGTVLCFGY